MSARRLARVAARNPHRPKGGIFARAGGGWMPAYRRGELRFTQSCATNGGQRGRARAARQTRTGRDHRHRRQREGRRAGSRDREGEDARLSLLDFRDVPAPKPKPIAEGKPIGAQDIKEMADESSLAMVAYISMAFGNPYGDSWTEEKLADATRSIFEMGIKAISLADTVGAAEPERIDRVVREVLRSCPEGEIGVHLHSTRATAGAKVLAAFDAGCRRFDSAIGGLGGCPFAQDDLVGNIPTEEVVGALEQRGVRLPMRDSLAHVMTMNRAISDEFSAEHELAGTPRCGVPGGKDSRYARENYRSFDSAPLRSGSQ